MKNSYDRTRAKRLVPLLEAISREISERSLEIEVLEQSIAALTEGSVTEASRRELLDARADLAIQFREVRLARKEVERLGCSVDETHPSRILIPGVDGNLDRGFRWDSSDGTIHRVTNTSVG